MHDVSTLVYISFAMGFVLLFLWTLRKERSSEKSGSWKDWAEETGLHYEDKSGGAPWYKFDGITKRRGPWYKLELMDSPRLDHALLSKPFPFMSRYKPPGLFRAFFRCGQVLWMAHGKINDRQILVGDVKLFIGSSKESGDLARLVIMEDQDIFPGIVIYRDPLFAFQGADWLNSFTIDSRNTAVRSQLKEMLAPPAKLTHIETIPGYLLNVYEIDGRMDGSRIIGWAFQMALTLARAKVKSVGLRSPYFDGGSKSVSDKARRRVRLTLKWMKPLVRMMCGFLIWLVLSYFGVLPEEMRIQRWAPFPFVEQFYDKLDLLKDYLLR
jgi:hypothetical protein